MIRSVLTAVVIVFLAACASVGSLMGPQAQSGFPIYFLDSQASDSLDLLDYRAKRLPSGHVSIAFTCQSVFEKKPAIIDWKVVFYDADHMPMDETAWHTEYIPPGEVKMLQASSIRTDCAAYEVQVRTPGHTRPHPRTVQGQQAGVVPPQGAPQQGTAPAQGNPPQGTLQTIQQITNEVLPVLQQIQK